ncbi:MAG: S41 family peptidase [Saprospiraceae bacterium]|nr:S41 family peptidase [Saprospiraceae bacterium]
MRKYLLILMALNLLGCSKQLGEQSGFSVFKSLRTGYQIMEFVSSCSSPVWKEHKWQAFSKELRSRGLSLADGSNTTIGNNTISTLPNSKIFSSPSGREIVLVEYFERDSIMENRWKEVWESIGMHSGIQNRLLGKYYLKLEDSFPISLNATFRNDAYIFNFKHELSFLNMEPKTWNSQEIEEFSEALRSLNENIKLLASYFIHEKDKIYYPLHDRVLNAQERLVGFVDFWTEVKYNFAFFDQVPDLDWDEVLLEYIPHFQKDQSNSEYYKLLSEVCALLNDGHTDIYPPSLLTSKLGQVPIELSAFEDGIFLTNFDTSYQSTLQLGYELIKVENEPISKYMERNILPYISASTDYIKLNKALLAVIEGENGTNLNMTFRNQEGVDVPFSAQMRKGNVNWVKEEQDWNLTSYKKQEGVGILTLNSFGNQRVVDQFESYLDSLVSIDRLVIDLRDNGGGNSGFGYQILDYFSDQPIITSKWQTREHKAAFKAWGDGIKEPIASLSEWEIEAKLTYEENFWYEASPDTLISTKDQLKNLEVMILIGNNTASAAEDFLIAAESIALGKTMGDFTFGSTGQPMFIRLPGGGSARICTKKDTYPNGKEFVGYGIQPDVVLKESIDNVLSGEDVVLQKAIELLNE